MVREWNEIRKKDEEKAQGKHRAVRRLHRNLYKEKGVEGRGRKGLGVSLEKRRGECIGRVK